MAIESLERGGWSAAEAISHAEAAINKISLNAAQIFATIAGKKFLNFIKHNLSEFTCAEIGQNQFQSFIGIDDAAFFYATALESDLI